MLKNTARSQIEIIRFFLSRYKLQTVLVFVSFLLAGILDAVGIVSVLPILNVALDTDNNASSPINIFINNIFSALSLPTTTGFLLFFIAIAFVIKAIILLFVMCYVSKITASIIKDFREELIADILNVKWQFYIKHPLGSFVNALVFETSQTASIYTIICRMGESLLMVLLLFSFAAITNWQLSLFSLVAAIILWLALGFLIKISRDTGREQAKLSKSLSAGLADMLQGIKPIKAMHQEHYIAPLLNEQIKELKSVNEKQIFTKYQQSILREPILVVLILIGLYFMLSTKAIAFSEAIVLIALFYRTVTSWSNFQQSYQLFAGKESFYFSLRTMINEAKKNLENYNSGKKHDFTDSITLENVGFDYTGNDRAILQNIFLTIKPGKMILLKGPSGAGKTTILDLLCCLYQPSTGKMIIDDKPANDIDLTYWRDQISYVTQEFVMFNDTLYQNITLRDEKITPQAVKEALQRADCMSFVDKLPEKEMTLVGERGVRLSGGQRQRIAIARGLARKPKLLILDESTTALDPQTERKICHSLKELTKEGMAIIAISHQPAIEEIADVIYEIKGCRLQVSGCS